jgi:tetratricopeptide (TPR) repeat protein
MTARFSIDRLRAGSIWKWVLLAGGGAAGLFLLVMAGWYWWDASQSKGRAALFEASRLAHEAASPQATAAQRSAADKALEGALAKYPRNPAAPEAAYLLGNLRHQSRSFAAAREAFQSVVQAGAGGSLTRLAQLGIGYALEGEGRHADALAAYQKASEGLKPTDFLYEEALLATARTQELLQQRSQALETYQKLIRSSSPGGRLAEEVRSRLVALGGESQP